MGSVDHRSARPRGSSTSASEESCKGETGATRMVQIDVLTSFNVFTRASSDESKSLDLKVDLRVRDDLLKPLL